MRSNADEFTAALELAPSRIDTLKLKQGVRNVTGNLIPKVSY
jgi:hypothetical protein